MKILLLANSDLASNYALNLLLQKLTSCELHLMMSSSVGGGKQRAPELEQLRFFEQRLINDIVFPLLERGTATHMKSFDGLYPPLQSTPLFENAINTREGLARVEAIGPDLIISIRYGGILKDEVISLPSLGVINLHSGRLPEYRGVMATFWAMLCGDQELGTTLHYIADGSIDTGSIISHTRTPLVTGKSYLWQVMNLYSDGVQQIIDAVDVLILGEKLVGTDQPSNGNYFTFPDQEDLDRFRRAGHALFDPSEIVELIQELYIAPPT